MKPRRNRRVLIGSASGLLLAFPQNGESARTEKREYAMDSRGRDGSELFTFQRAGEA